MNQRTHVAPALAAALALSACAGATPSATEGPIAVYQPVSMEVTTPSDYTGTIEIIEGCLILVETADQFVPQFPADDVEWDEASQTLTYGGQSYGIGETLTVTLGGEAARDSPRPTQCPAGRYGLVVPLEVQSSS